MVCALSSPRSSSLPLSGMLIAGGLLAASLHLIPALSAVEAAADVGAAAGAVSDTLPSDGELLAAARTASTAYQNHLEELTITLSNSVPAARIEALRTLGQLQDPVATASIVTFLDQPQRPIDELIAAAVAIGTSDQSVGLPALRKLTVNSDEQVRLAAYNSIGSLQKTTAGDHTQRAKDSSELPHLAALTNLGTIKQADAAPLLIAGLQRHPRAILRRMCAIGLGKLGDQANGPILQNALSDADPGVRRYAAEAIATIGYRPAIPFIIFALEANVSGPELAAVLRRMTGQDFGFNSREDELHRKAAVERGFAWWTANSKDGG